MRVGTLYAVLRLNTGAFDAALANSSSRWTKFTSALRAGTFIAAEAFGAVLVGSVLAAQSFQEHMTQSLAIMGDVSDQTRAKMEEAARSIAKTTLFSATEAADAFYFLASAGYTAQQSIALLPQVAAFAQAGLLNLEDATQTLAAIQVTLGMRTGDVTQDMANMARISDVLTEAANVSLGTIEGYSDALSRQAGPALRSVNKSVEEGVAVLSVFADQNIIGARAGTALAVVLRDLQSKAIKNGDAFSKYGVAVFDANGKMRNMADIVGDLEGALAGMSDEQKKATLMEMGFTDKSVGFIMALLGQSEAIRKYQKDLEAAGGATQEVAAKQLESFSAQLTIMWHKINDVGIAIGMKMLPGLTQAATAVGDWFDKNEDLIVQLVTGFLGAIGEVAKFLGGVLGPVLEYVGDKIGWVHDKALLFADAWHQVFDRVNKVSGKIQGLIDIIDDGGEKIEPVTGKVKGLIDQLERGDDVLNPFIGALKVIKEKFEEVAKVLKPVIDYLQEHNILGQILAGTILGVLGGALVALLGWLFPFVRIATLVIGATALLSAAWEEWGDEITTGVGQALQWFNENIYPTLKEAINWLKDDGIPTVLGWFEKLGDWLADIWPTVSKAAGDLFTWLYEEVIVPVGEGISWFAENVLPKLEKAFNAVVQWVQDNWPLISSTVGQVLGAVGDAFKLARDVIAVWVPFVWDQLEPIAEVLFPLLGTAATTFLWIIRSTFGTIQLIITILSIVFHALFGENGVIPKAIQWAGSVIQTVSDAIIDNLGKVVDAVNAAKDAVIGFNGLNPFEPGAIFKNLPWDPNRTNTSGWSAPAPSTPTGTNYTYKTPTFSFATGTPWFGGGMALVGEQGPELVNLPRGSSVMNTNDTMGMLGGLGRFVIEHLELNGIGSDVSPSAARRFGQAVADEVAVIIQEQSSRFPNTPGVVQR